MKSINAGIILTTGCLIVAFAGCQAGKSSMGNLAWWKKDDTLASEYLEPPSHNFTPSDSAVVNDDSNLPPLPPDIEKTVDSFEQDVARSYRELARKSGNPQARLAMDTRDVDVDTRNITVPPVRESTGSTSSNPLTPRPVDRYASNTMSQGSGSRALDREPSGLAKKGSTDSSDGFNPASQGITQYERIAQQSLLPDGTSPSTSFDGSRPEARMPGSFSPEPTSSTGNHGFQPGPPSTTKSTGMPLSPLKPSGSSTLPPPQNDNNQVNSEYPSTAYHAFAPREIPSVDPPGPPMNPSFGPVENSNTGQADGTQSNIAVNPASTGMTLQIQGQGSYAPGSIRAPNPIDPAALVLPMSQSGSTTK